MSIEMLYRDDRVTITDNGKLITSGNTDQHYITAKNALDKCLEDGYDLDVKDGNALFNRKITLTRKD